MLKITVDLIPLGIEQYRTKIAKATIHNDGTGDEDVANYVGEFWIHETLYLPEQKMTVFAKGIERKKRPVWEFLYEVLKEHYEDEEAL